jgi:hypothetical protein
VWRGCASEDGAGSARGSRWQGRARERGRGQASESAPGGRARDPGQERATEPGSGAARPKLGPVAARGSQGPGADELSGIKQHEPSRGDGGGRASEIGG